MMATLLGILGTTFVLDIVEGTVRLRDWHKFVGFAITLVGVAVDNADNFGKGSSVDGVWIVNFVAVYLSGISTAMQVKCNSQLQQGIGGSMRAAFVCNMVAIACGIPGSFILGAVTHVPFTVDWSIFVPFVLIGGLVNVFVVSSMAKLPSFLGFTANYVCTLFGKLICAMAIDAFGIAGKTLSITFMRVAALVIVLVGAGLFNAKPPPRRVQASDDADEPFRGPKA